MDSPPILNLPTKLQESIDAPPIEPLTLKYIFIFSSRCVFRYPLSRFIYGLPSLVLPTFFLHTPKSFVFFATICARSVKLRAHLSRLCRLFFALSVLSYGNPLIPFSVRLFGLLFCDGAVYGSLKTIKSPAPKKREGMLVVPFPCRFSFLDRTPRSVSGGM